MALFLKETPGSDFMGEIEEPEINAALLMSLFEESHECEDQYCNEEQVNRLMESLEAEIRMARNDSLSNAGDMESNDGFDCFEWTGMEMEMVPSSPSDDMNWYVDDHVEEMDGLLEFGIDFPQSYYEIPLEHGYGSLWQETYETAIYN